MPRQRTKAAPTKITKHHAHEIEPDSQAHRTVWEGERSGDEKDDDSDGEDEDEDEEEFDVG